MGMIKSDIAERRFTEEGQKAFARLSGDYNPVHIDAARARRLLFGRPVVHGIHLLLWALDSALGDATEPLALGRLSVSFPKPAAVGDAVTCRVHWAESQELAIELCVAEQKVVAIRASFTPADRPLLSEIPQQAPIREDPRDISQDEALGTRGHVPLALDKALAARLFPNLVRRLPDAQLAAILATTRVVGMRCPGLHSIFSELVLTSEDGGQWEPVLCYEVTRCDRRFGYVTMRIAAPGMNGTIASFVRPRPSSQVTLAELKQVEPDEFAEQRALVIGGSRGLGEISAKLLAAGGARVRISYHRGEDDARRVSDEIAAIARSGGYFALDVLDSPEVIQCSLEGDWAPTHLYYFATPPIFVAKRKSFSDRLFQTFSDYYVRGFLNTLTAARRAANSLRAAFYPSSVAVHELPADMGEYAAAKAAGEILCDFLAKTNPEMSVFRTRLPRLATDQTASVMPIKDENPAVLMLEKLRDFHRATRKSSRAAPGTRGREMDCVTN